MQTIILNYLYRDASNYKNYGNVIFSNQKGLEVSEIERLITASLVDGEYFVAEEWGLPTLYFEDWTQDDHNLHEYAGLEISTDDLETAMGINDLLSNILKTKTGP